MPVFTTGCLWGGHDSAPRVLPTAPTRALLIIMVMTTYHEVQLTRWGDSAATCVGGDSSNISWYRNTCVYRDMCFSKSNGFLLFDPYDTIDIQYVSVSLCVMGGWDWNPCLFTPTVLRTSLSQYIANIGNESKFTWFKTPVALFMSDELLSFGHFIGDLVLPLYQLLYTHNIDNVNFSIIKINPEKRFSKYTCADVKKEQVHRRPYVCDRLTDFFHLVFPSQLSLETDPDAVVCFEKVIAGIGYHSDHCIDVTAHGRRQFRHDEHICNLGLSPMFRNFREFITNRLNISDPQYTAGDRSGKLVILVSGEASPGRARKHYKGWGDLARIITGAVSNWTLCGPIVVRHLNISTSIKEQIIAVSKSAVFVSTSGSVSLISLFLRDAATRVVVFASTSGKGSTKLDQQLFNQLYPSRTVYISDRNMTHQLSYVPHVIRAILHGLWRYCDSGSFYTPPLPKEREREIP